MPRKTLQERAAELEQRRQQLTARLTKLQAQAKQQSRKKDTRQKIIVGAAVLAHAQHDDKFSRALTDILERAVSRPLDRDTIAGLLKKTA